MRQACASYALVVAVFCLPPLLEGQSEISSFDGYTPGEVMAGGPAGSQALSGFETYNPGSGVLTLNLPLLTVKGRGSVSVPITVPLNTDLWARTATSNGDIFSTAGWDPLPYRFGAGRMLFRASGDYCVPNPAGGPGAQMWNYVLTRATFVAPDGTETEYIDQSGGLQEHYGGYNRGTVFTADNGTLAKFTSATSISDPTACDSSVTPATGTLVFRDGTQYTLTDGYVTAIHDRNGNTTSLSPNSIVDSMGRTYTFASGTNPSGRNYATVQYPDSNGTRQTITIWYSPLDQVLAQGESIETFGQIWQNACQPACFSGGNTDQLYDPNDRVAEVDLADGSKYTATYHSDGSVAQITLPAGGTVQYGYTYYADFWSASQENMWLLALQLFERREYVGGTLISRTDIYGPAQDPRLGPNGPWLSRISHYDGSGTSFGTGNLLDKEKYIFGSTGTGPTSGTNYNPPQYNQFPEIVYYAGGDNTAWADDGTTTLATEALAFANGSCKVNCSTPQQVITTVGGVTKEFDYSYDQYNNQTDEKDYDWGSGAHGNLLRDIQTVYSTSYTAQNILNLPSQKTVYDGSGNEAAQTLFSYDGNGNLIQQQQLIASGQYATTKYTYDSNGDVTSVTDPDNHMTSFGYSPSSAPPTSITNAKSQQTSITYNGLDQPVSITDLNGNVTSFSYNDPLNRLTGITLPNGGHTYESYPSPTQVITQQDQNSSGDMALKSQTLYDGFGRAIESDTFESASQYIATTTQYDPLGRVATITNPSRPGDGLNYPTTYSYDALSRPTQVKTADGATATTSYSGNQTTVTDQAGNSKTMTYDALGRLTGVTDATGTTTYTYNALGNLIKVAQGSQTRTFAYDMLGRMTRGTNPESGTVTYVYDAAGNLTSRTDARGVTTTYTYDALNRPIYTSYYDSTPAVTYSYDSGTNGKGHLTGLSNQNSATGFTYDAMGRVVSSDQVTTPNQYNFSYAYNLAGALTSETYPSGRVVTTSYDGADRVAGVSGQLGSRQTNYVSGVSYTPQGAANRYSYGNNLWRTLAFTSRLEWATADDEINQNSGYNLLHQVYSWSTNGTNDNGTLRSSQFWNGGGPGTNWIQFDQTYNYDGVNRLTLASDSGGWSRGFDYDQYGNMWVDPNKTSGVPSGAAPTSNVYDPSSNRISGGSYDAAGNQTLVNGDTLTYDANGHMSSAYDNVTHGTETYLYDGGGQRVMKFGPSGETVYVYDAFGQLAAEYSTVPQNAPCTTCYLSYDQRGDVRLVTDQNGNVVARHDYLPFGIEVPANIAGRNSQWGSTTDVEQKFTGQIRDTETGMDYFQARYYGSAFGRFTSPDPANAGADPLNPQSWNGYAYVGNNPLTLTDPSGMGTMGPCNLHNMMPGCTPPDPSTDYQGYAAYVNNMMENNPFADPLEGYDTFRLMSVTTVIGYQQTTVKSTDNSISILSTPIYGTSFVADSGGMSQSTAAGIVAASAPPAPTQNPAPARTSGTSSPVQKSTPPTNNTTHNDVPLNPYARAVFTDPTLQTTAKVMTSPCTYAAWGAAAATAGTAGAAAANITEILAVISDNSASLTHKALTWWFNFTGRPSSGLTRAAKLTAPAAAGAMTKVCSSF